MTIYHLHRLTPRWHLNEKKSVLMNSSSGRFVVLLLCSLLTVRVTASLDLHVISSMVWYLKDQMVSLEDGHVPSRVFHSMSLYRCKSLLQLVPAHAFYSLLHVVRLLYSLRAYYHSAEAHPPACPTRTSTSSAEDVQGEDI